MEKGSLDPLWQWGTQINIPEIQGTANEEIKCDMVDAPREGINTGDRKKSQTVPMIQKQDHRNQISKFIKRATADIPTVLPLKWLSNRPVLQGQWPITKGKLQALEQLVKNSWRLNI